MGRPYFQKVAGEGELYEVFNANGRLVMIVPTERLAKQGVSALSDDLDPSYEVGSEKFTPPVRGGGVSKGGGGGRKE